MATPKTWTLDLPVISFRRRGVLRLCSSSEVRVDWGRTSGSELRRDYSRVAVSSHAPTKAVMSPQLQTAIHKCLLAPVRAPPVGLLHAAFLIIECCNGHDAYVARCFPRQGVIDL